ncbi:hypothetical protein BDZ97DRAFT_1924665 [Flammula alnicola]|nr:hypothetical protein BDZ97DRAFT_2083356 [Flammula alnicola]KAF8957416.1 hypothetical protein BDZ97DRAFT_1924665 [Flammula alnicola]
MSQRQGCPLCSATSSSLPEGYLSRRTTNKEPRNVSSRSALSGSLGLANADHTTLLLNTYTKLKDVVRLDSFIKTESRRNAKADGGDAEELPFDLVTAIRVCRQAGYFEHASYLAKKYDRHEDYLRIQIEDAGNFADALALCKLMNHLVG